MIPVLDLANSLLGGYRHRTPGFGGILLWDPASKSANLTVSNADRTAAANNNLHESVASVQTFANTGGGKYYTEIRVDTLGNNGDIYIGLRRAIDTTASGVSPLTGGATEYALWNGGGGYNANVWTPSGTPATLAATNIIMLAIDEAAGKLWTGRNGTWNNSGNPATGANASFTGLSSSAHRIYMSTDNVGGSAVQVTIQATFTHTEPDGFIGI